MVSAYYWNGGATLTLLDQTGQAMTGAEVTLEVRTKVIDRYGRTSWPTTTLQGTVGADGQLQIETGPHKFSGSNRVTELIYTVTDVTVPAPGAWDGSSASITIDPP